MLLDKPLMAIRVLVQVVSSLTSTTIADLPLPLVYLDFQGQQTLELSMEKDITKLLDPKYPLKQRTHTSITYTSVNNSIICNFERLGASCKGNKRGGSWTLLKKEKIIFVDLIAAKYVI